LAICQLAAVGDPGGQLVSEERLDLAASTPTCTTERVDTPAT
jgi:hypothetical protein